jgi:5-methylcytosine-specific restriction endonuclease McrA
MKMPSQNRLVRAAQSKAYYETHKEEIAAKSRAYRQAHREKIAMRTKAYHEAHREERAVKAAAYFQAHKEARAIQKHNYYETHKAERVAWQKAYREAHKEERRAYAKAYGQTHKEKRAAKAAAYYITHKERIAAYQRAHPAVAQAAKNRRRARKAGAAIRDFTAAQWRAMQAHYDHRCAYCGTRAKGHLTHDHITPLSKGGNHTLVNIVPACRSCNNRKHVGPPLAQVQPLFLVAP